MCVLPSFKDKLTGGGGSRNPPAQGLRRAENWTSNGVKGKLKVQEQVCGEGLLTSWH